MPMTDEEFIVELAKKLREVHDSSHEADVAIMELVNAMAKRIVALEKRLTENEEKINLYVRKTVN